MPERRIEKRKDWMALAFVRQILMFDKFAPGILAVIKGRITEDRRRVERQSGILKLITVELRCSRKCTPRYGGCDII